MEENFKHIPEAVLKRLVRYHFLLTKIDNPENTMISSTSLSEELKFDSIQVRKDIQYTNLVGKPKLGWNVKMLINAIEATLNWNNYNDAFLVGAGRLGQTLLMYDGFKNYGLNFVAAFDVNSDLINKEFNGVKVLPLSKLVNLERRMHVHIGVITVPAIAAQEAADLLIEGGILAIWNFAPMQIKVPENTIVVNAQLSQDIAILTNKLAALLKKQNK